MSSPESASSKLDYPEHAVNFDTDAWISNDKAFTDLINSELSHAPRQDYLTRLREPTPSSDAVNSRRDSVKWILSAHKFHSFSHVTAFLSVVFLDRFLSSHSLPSGWPFQLLSVACLSLAVKMEETRTPLLLDLQVCDPKFVFEPKTVQRMELRVLANLDWRLRAVTPFDFLHYFVPKVYSSSLSQIFSASSDLILSTTLVTEFLGYAPSEIAAAATISAVRNVSDDRVETTTFHERVNKEMVRSCHQLMEEHVIGTCLSSRRKGRVRAEPSAPRSPIGVLDAVCESCDTAPESEHVEPTASKRLRSSALDVQQR